MIRESSSPRKEQDLERRSATRRSTGPIQKVQAILSTPITGFCTIESLTWLVVAIGVWLRVLEYSAYRELYMDEESLLRNLTGLAVFDFHTRLSEEQLAPPGFLVVERLMVRLGLDLVWSARFLPLVCGISSVFLMRLVARRFISRPAVPIAVGLFALSEWLLYYSAEIKQYSTDLALTLVALLLAAKLMAARPLERRTPSRTAERRQNGRRLLLENQRRIRQTQSPCAANCWLSPSSARLASGFLTRWRLCSPGSERGSWRRPRSAAIGRMCSELWVSLVWAASFAGCFAVSHAILTTGQFIWNWWDFAFLPIPPRSAADLERDFWQMVNVFNSPADVLTPLGVLPSAFVALGLFLTGAVALGRRRPGGLYLVASPILFALMASALRQYPFHGRLLVFLVPTVHLLVAEGAESLARGGLLLLRGLAARSPDGALDQDRSCLHLRAYWRFASVSSLPIGGRQHVALHDQEAST